VAGGIASGRVPAAGGGDPLQSWVNPTSALGGIAVLDADAHRLDERLLGPTLPLVLISAVTGGAALLLLRRASPHQRRAERACGRRARGVRARRPSAGAATRASG
jgi:hypothetical protein